MHIAQSIGRPSLWTNRRDAQQQLGSFADLAEKAGGGDVGAVVGTGEFTVCAVIAISRVVVGDGKGGKYPAALAWTTLLIYISIYDRGLMIGG